MQAEFRCGCCRREFKAELPPLWMDDWPECPSGEKAHQVVLIGCEEWRALIWEAAGGGDQYPSAEGSPPAL